MTQQSATASMTTGMELADNLVGNETSAGVMWQLLRLLNLFRAIAGGLFVTLFVSGDQHQHLGGFQPSLFLWTGVAYFGFSVLASFSIRARRPSLRLQTYTQICADIAAVTLLMYASGGLVSGIGSLMFVSLAGASLLLPMREAVAAASMATLAVLGQELLAQVHGSPQQPGYAQAGLLGMIFFATTLVGNLLAARIRESEALASRRESELQDLSQLNNFIIQQMNTGIVVVDANGRIRLTNSSAKSLLEVDEDMSARELSGMIPRLAQILDEWQNDPYGRIPPLAVSRRHTVIPHFASLGEHRDAGTLIFLEDAGQVIERVRQTKLAALGRLTASIAHEIRNPLGAVSHANQLLAESAQIAGQERRLTEIINENAGRVNRIVENVLQLSRRDTVRIEKLNLHNWLQDFRTDFVARDRSGATLAVRAAADTDIQIRFDPSHLDQIMTNLVENAARHGGEQGVELKIGLDAGGREPYLEILDRGAGVPQDIAEHIFEPFYTSTAKGTGLGLFIARELCECNQAVLTYMEREGGGSCFRIDFHDPQRWVT